MLLVVPLVELRLVLRVDIHGHHQYRAPDVLRGGVAVPVLHSCRSFPFLSAFAARSPLTAYQYSNDRLWLTLSLHNAIVSEMGKLNVNGVEREADVPAGRLLLDFLRYDLGLTGSKESCGVGVCGACTVLVDGELHASCITLAAAVEGAEVTTIEGIAGPRAASPGAAGVHRLRWLPVRHLYAGAGHRRQGPAGLQPPSLPKTKSKIG